MTVKYSYLVLNIIWLPKILKEIYSCIIISYFEMEGVCKC